MSNAEMWAVDEAMCRVIARADRWLTVSLAIDALRAAELQWMATEKEARREVPDDAAAVAAAAPDAPVAVTPEVPEAHDVKCALITNPLATHCTCAAVVEEYNRQNNQPEPLRMPEIPAAQRRS